MVSKRWIWAACLAVLFAGQSQAHVHYCFDGHEPPMSVHLADGIDPGHEHPDHDADEGCQDDVDVDLNPAELALGKVFKLDQPDLAAVFGSSVIVASPGAGVLVDWIELPQTSDPPFARPQVRGPPA
jgi:hypothetical protein